jgi:integrase/recombinase XerC
MARLNKPWFRTSSGRWYITLDNVQTPLPVTDPIAVGDATQAMIDLIIKRRSGPEIKSGTMAELVQQFLDSRRKKGATAKTIRSYGGYLKWLVARFGNRAIVGIDPDDLTSKAAATDWSSTTQHNVISTANSFIRWCGRADFQASTPPKESRGGESVVTPEVFAMLLKETSGDFHDLLRVLWLTGARPSEILGLTVEGINWETRTARLTKHKTAKKGKQRIIRLGAETLPILKALADKHKRGPLFRGLGGKPLSLHAVIVRLLRLCNKLGVKVTSYHFRHTFATRLLVDGVPDTHVAAMLGHSSTRMIHANYSHVSQNSKLLAEIADKYG